MSAPLILLPQAHVPAEPPRAAGTGGVAICTRSQRHVTWQRAMERELCQSWFQDAIRADGGRQGGHSGSAPRVAPTNPGQPHPSGRDAVPHADNRVGPSCSPALGSAPHLGVAASVWVRSAGGRATAELAFLRCGRIDSPVEWVGPLCTASPARGGRSESGAAASPVVARPSRTPSDCDKPTVSLPPMARTIASGGCSGVAAGSHEPLRLHAEWSEGGLRLWMRADPRMPVERLVRLVVRQLLPRCAELGSPLLAVVCNGQTVWDRHDPSTRGSSTPNQQLPLHAPREVR
jgi:hypothetical protein